MVYEDIDIKKLLEKSSNLNDLEIHLAEEGYTFKSSNKLKKFLYEVWGVKNWNLIIEVIKKPVIEIEDLPYSEVTRDGIIYRVHGLAHSQIPFISISPKVKEFVSNKVRNYKNRPEEDYLLELGFAKNFDLDESQEMNVFNEVKNRVGESEVWRSILEDLSSCMKKRIRKSKYKLANKIVQNYNKILIDPNYIPRGREIYSLLRKLPETFNLELKLRIGNKFDVYISEEMSKFMLHYAHSKNLRILHGIVGLEHESEICYYLKTLSQNRINNNLSK
jgi:hypothetical protein